MINNLRYFPFICEAQLVFLLPASCFFAYNDVTYGYMLYVVKPLWWPLVNVSCYYTVKLQSSLWKVNRDSYVRKHDFYQSAQRDISCVPTSMLSLHKVCQKQIYKYQDAQLHSVVFYSMQATVLFCQFWPTILCAAAATSRRLSHRESTDRRQLIDRWRKSKWQLTARGSKFKAQCCDG